MKLSLLMRLFTTSVYYSVPRRSHNHCSALIPHFMPITNNSSLAFPITISTSHSYCKQPCKQPLAVATPLVPPGTNHIWHPSLLPPFPYQVPFTFWTVFAPTYSSAYSASTFFSLPGSFFIWMIPTQLSFLSLIIGLS